MTSTNSSRDGPFASFDDETGSYNVREKARNYIRNLMPRKPQRLNDVSYRFDKLKKRHQLLNSAV